MNRCAVLAGALVIALVLCQATAWAQTAGPQAPDATCGGGYSLWLDGIPPSGQGVLGDLNGDGHVDVIDLLIFVDTFGKMLGDPGFNAEADFNCDGSIDVIDLLTFVANFGT